MRRMRVIKLTQEQIKEICGRSEYKRSVLLRGHKTGVLSGAELASGQARWGWYRRARADVELGAHFLGVQSALAGANRARVWQDADDGALVRFEED